MNPFEHENQYLIHLCENTDEQPFICLQYVLEHELQAQQLNKWSGAGGSQEISWMKFSVDGEVVTIQSETYEGLKVFGARTVVEDLVKRVQRRLSETQSKDTSSPLCAE